MSQAKHDTTSMLRKKKLKESVRNTRLKAIKDKQSRVEVLQHISDVTGLKRVEVQAVFLELSNLIRSHMKKGGSGRFNVPWAGIGVRRRKRKATKERKMLSPFTGTEVVIPAKPAREEVKLIVLKNLKESVD